MAKSKIPEDVKAQAIVDNFYEEEEPHLLDRSRVLKGWHKDRIKEAMYDALEDQIDEQDENDDTIKTIIRILKRRF